MTKSERLFSYAQQDLARFSDLNEFQIGAIAIAIANTDLSKDDKTAVLQSLSDYYKKQALL